MKILVNILRVIVGLLFIFSGLVKANDPLGLSYKMQEFFEIWGLHQFNSWTLLMSVLMNAFEIIAGFALLLGWRIRLFSWLLLLLIVFFTFLTGYTYITGNPKNCGCFGDCLPISSKTSFLKDVVLTIMIGFLFWQQKKIKPLFNEKAVTIVMLVVTLLSFGFQWYTLKYLPVVDCLPFKKGNNIAEKMKMPSNAIPDSTVITFVYKKDGKEVEFTADQFPTDFNGTTYQFVSRYDKVIRKGKNNEPPIKGFVLSGETNVDSTSFVLQQPYVLLLFIENFSKAGKGWKDGFASLYNTARTKNIPAFIITSDPGAAKEAIAGTAFSGVQVFKCDYKVIETAARAAACVYILEKGVVKGKWSSPNFSQANKFMEGR
ncbi:MAG TPA: BT_3928 family protein [Chitinophagaceae bacterium]|nr:BT_3928 family protein [Chitinophagaceae bacterium]